MANANANVHPTAPPTIAHRNSNPIEAAIRSTVTKGIQFLAGLNRVLMP